MGTKLDRFAQFPNGSTGLPHCDRPGCLRSPSKPDPLGEGTAPPTKSQALAG